MIKGRRAMLVELSATEQLLAEQPAQSGELDGITQTR